MSSDRNEVRLRVERSRVLVAEDDLEMRRLIAGALRDDGYDVIEASDGIELLDRLAAFILYDRPDETPHLIISDVRMPGITGLDVLSGMNDSTLRVPIILITAFGDEQTHMRAAELGAVAMFDKPFRLRELREVVHGLRPPTTHVPVRETHSQEPS